MMKSFITLSAAVLLLFACGNRNARKMTLGAVEEQVETPASTLVDSETVLDTIIPAPGIRHRENRRIDPSAPPQVIDLTSDPAVQALDLSDYYSTVKYVKLTHPQAGKGYGFLDGIQTGVQFEGGGGYFNMGRGAFSKAILTEDRIVAGDEFYGYHVYDLSGNYQYTIDQSDNPPPYSGNISHAVRAGDKFIVDLKVSGEYAVYLYRQAGKHFLQFHHIPTRKNYLQRPWYGVSTFPYPLGGEILATTPRSTFEKDDDAFLYLFDAKGDTLSRFINYTPRAADPPARANIFSPRQTELHPYAGSLTVRQSYNDTIFRLTPPARLKPAYVVRHGDRKLDAETYQYGEKKGKLFQNQWIETDGFVFLGYTDNLASPNNVRAGLVDYLYWWYDKQAKRLYRLPENESSDNLLLTGSDEAIPLLPASAKTDGKRLYAAFTCSQLDRIIENPRFASLPAAQQEKVKSLRADLDKKEMLLMILE